MLETKIVAYGPGKEATTFAGNTTEVAEAIRNLVEQGYDEFKMVPNVDE